MKFLSGFVVAVFIALAMSGCGVVLKDVPGFRNPPSPKAVLPARVADEVRGKKVLVRVRGGQEVWGVVVDALKDKNVHAQVVVGGEASFLFDVRTERTGYSGYNPHGVQYVPQMLIRVHILVLRGQEVLFRGLGASGTTSRDRESVWYATEHATREALLNLR